jgi:hypothetical protein
MLQIDSINKAFIECKIIDVSSHLLKYCVDNLLYPLSIEKYISFRTNLFTLANSCESKFIDVTDKLNFYFSICSCLTSTINLNELFNISVKNLFINNLCIFEINKISPLKIPIQLLSAWDTHYVGLANDVILKQPLCNLTKNIRLDLFINQFEPDIYKKLNPDLKDLEKNELIIHWQTKGIYEKRLYSEKQLIVSNEFGNEVIFYIPYFYYLYKNNLLFDNKITTYNGMRPFYYFLKQEQLIEISLKRRHNRLVEIFPFINNLLSDTSEYGQLEIDRTCMLPPPYKNLYEINPLDKPLLILHNKGVTDLCSMQNYIQVDILDLLFDKLKNKYQIIYIRPKNSWELNGFSSDKEFIQNENIKDYDYDLIKNKHCNIITIDNLCKKYNSMQYNDIILQLYSSCENYISAQGGSSWLMTYFYKQMVIYHKEGGEKECYFDPSWMYQMNDFKNKVIKVGYTDEEFIENCIRLFT